MPEVLDELFTTCGKNPQIITATQDYLLLQNILSDGKVFHAYANAEDFAQEFERVFGERSDHVLEYLHHAQKFLN